MFIFVFEKLQWEWKSGNKLISVGGVGSLYPALHQNLSESGEKL